MSSFIQGFINCEDVEKSGGKELSFDIDPVDNYGYCDSAGETFKVGYGYVLGETNTNMNRKDNIDYEGVPEYGITCTSDGSVDMMHYGNTVPVGVPVRHHSYPGDYGFDFDHSYGLGIYPQNQYPQGYTQEYFSQEYAHYPSQVHSAVQETVQDMNQNQNYSGQSEREIQGMYSQNINETQSDLSDGVSDAETKLSTPESFTASVKLYDPLDIPSNLKRPLLTTHLKEKHDYSLLSSRSHPVSCSHCNDDFKSLLLLAEHFDKHKLTTAHKCPFDSCPFNLIGFSRKADLRRHCLTNHFEKGKLTQSINQNVKLVLNNLIYSCKMDNCGKNFYRKDSLQRHLKLVHENENSKFNKKMKKIQLQKSTARRYAHVAQK